VVRALPNPEQLEIDIWRLRWILHKLKSLRKVRDILDGIESFGREREADHAS
jgi:hypothetical protein